MGKTLRELREERGLTQEDMAKLINVTLVGYHFYETGKRNIPANKAIEIANFFGIKIDDIFLPNTFSIR